MLKQGLSNSSCKAQPSQLGSIFTSIKIDISITDYHGAAFGVVLPRLKNGTVHLADEQVAMVVSLHIAHGAHATAAAGILVNKENTNQGGPSPST